MDNVILSATHTHAGAGGFWHYGASSPLGSSLILEHYEAIVAGIAESIVQAHESLAPGKILLDRGTVEDAGANRSMPAYLNNPEEERARYDAPHDRDMTLLRFERDGEAIGTLNWFAVHPTAMTYNNRLISGDHKGRASQLFESARAEGFVAGFAQANCGDITANLNLDNTGPGADEFETTHIIGDRQYQKAAELFANASEELQGGIDFRRTYINFKWADVDAAWAGRTDAMTCPSAYGYSFAAGSTEDGGGHPMFKEGMTIPNQMVDNLVKEQFKMDPPSEECKTCQAEKAILFASGEMDPPGYTQIVPMTLARIGQLVLVCVPAEFTTMAGRRLRDTVQQALGEEGFYVLAGYANDYCGYVTTREEYATQQYEGGHTLYGPHTLAQYQQNFDRLAHAMKTGDAVDAGPTPVDLRAEVEGSSIHAGPDVTPLTGTFGDVITAPEKSYKAAKQVLAAFWSGNPDNAYPAESPYVEIQRKSDSGFTTVATDHDWETKVRWTRPTIEADTGTGEQLPAAFRCDITWEIPENTEAGTYRIVHNGNYESSDGEVHTFSSATEEFRVK
jgi:neutral ceramidase